MKIRITDRNKLRKDFSDANPTKRILDRTGKYFTSDYVEHLENLYCKKHRNKRDKDDHKRKELAELKRLKEKYEE